MPRPETKLDFSRISTRPPGAASRGSVRTPRAEARAWYTQHFGGIDALVQYMAEQHIIAAPMPVEELFVPLPGAHDL